jgi:predicted MFS family arabinose efflux permease
LSAVAIFFVGAAYLAALASFTTVAQLRAPGHFRGRVLSVNNVLLGSCYPIGAVVQGALGDSIGLRTTTALSAVTIALALVLVRIVRPRLSEAVDAPPVVELAA